MLQKYRLRETVLNPELTPSPTDSGLELTLLNAGFVSTCTNAEIFWNSSGQAWFSDTKFQEKRINILGEIMNGKPTSTALD
jgi:hypothetical protein